MPEIILEFSADGSSWTIDATESINPTYTQTVTSNVVEKGANVTDHIRQQPLTLSITGFIGDAPLDAPSDFNISEAGEVTGTGKVTGRVWDPTEETKPVLFGRRLEQAASTGELMTIDAGEDSKGIYENMVITTYTPNWDNQHGFSLPFSLNFQQIVFATTEKKKLPPKPKPDGTAPANTTTNKPGVPANNAATAKTEDQRRFVEPVARGEGHGGRVDTSGAVMGSVQGASFYEDWPIDNHRMVPLNVSP